MSLLDPSLINQVLLPISLGLMMLAMGLSLQPQHFAKLRQSPKAISLGLTMQLLLLPLLAWIWIGLLALPTSVAAGLILVALAPGGATSNLISFLAKGDTALSVCLTAITSLIVPFTLPLLLNLQFSWLGMNAQEFNLPLGLTIAQLCAVTIVPIIIGMALRYRFQATATALQPLVQKLVGLGFITLVLLMALANQAALPEIFSRASAAVLLMCCSAMLLAYGASKLFGLVEAQKTCLTVEVGIQNAGTAMMVAASLLHQPELAMIPLVYGIAMNIPAFALIAWRQRA